MTNDLPLAKRVDHLMIEHETPAALFTLFSEQLALPIAWPFKDFGGYESGGVCAGDINLEFIRFKESDPRYEKLNAARITGLALEPAFDFAILQQQLATLKIPFRLGEQNETFSVLIVEGFVAAPFAVFFCQYHFDAPAWQTKLRAQLAEKHGGPLGVTNTAAVTLVPMNSANDWKQILAKSTENPRVVLARGTQSKIESVTLKVRSVTSARKGLTSLGIEHQQIGDQVKLDETALKGLSIFLSE
ncbi:MAG: hypothetical protein JST16_06540 [Bdellovibrionales bacterium]|nr:hypothetical protein [Bdellovibrionales bacterium]